MVSAFFLLFENSKAMADFDTKAVSKIDQKWRILTRRRSVKSISWNASGSAEGPKQQPSLNNHVNLWHGRDVHGLHGVSGRRELFVLPDQALHTFMHREAGHKDKHQNTKHSASMNESANHYNLNQNGYVPFMEVCKLRSCPAKMLQTFRSSCWQNFGIA